MVPSDDGTAEQAPAPTGYSLRVVEVPEGLGHPRPGQSFALGVTCFVVGRDPGADLRVASTESHFISRRTLLITWDGSTHLLQHHLRVDLRINGRLIRVGEPAALREGDLIRVGPMKFRVERR